MKIVAGTAGIPLEPVLHKVGNPKRGILCVVVKIKINQNKNDNLVRHPHPQYMCLIL